MPVKLLHDMSCRNMRKRDSKRVEGKLIVVNAPFKWSIGPGVVVVAVVEPHDEGSGSLPWPFLLLSTTLIMDLVSIFPSITT
jgi:hypothetical protein